MAVDFDKMPIMGSHRVWAYNDVKSIINQMQQEGPTQEANSRLPDEEEQPKKKRPKILSMFYALLMCLLYVALAIGSNILSHKLFGLYCGIDSITFSMVFTIIWVLCYLSIKEE